LPHGRLMQLLTSFQTTGAYLETHLGYCALIIMGLLESGPIEVIVRILRGCDDFPQLLSFITTCKRLPSAWLSNPGTIIWGVGKRGILCFDDALMAVSDASSDALHVSPHSVPSGPALERTNSDQRPRTMVSPLLFSSSLVSRSAGISTIDSATTHLPKILIQAHSAISHFTHLRGPVCFLRENRVIT
jgi:hypothetical protein